MYDKIKLILYDLPTGYDWQTVLQRTVVKDYFANGTGGKGYWLGRRVIATETYVSFEGSLPKCLWGHNLKTLSLQQVKWLIMKLSKDLGVPMHKAVVESAEFAHNFSMTEPPIMYMQKLDAMKKFRPNEWNGTKYIEDEEVRCKFYDKIQEEKKKRELPKYGRENLPRNLLRYEVTFSTKGLNRLFGRDIVAEGSIGRAQPKTYQIQ